MSSTGGQSARGVLPQLGRLFQRGSVTGFSEAQLLEAFIARRDEAAFEAIIKKHGPMVLGVCRQILRDPNDIEDAFQATFIVLVRRATSLQRHELLGNWLYGVAYRVAIRARSQATRRQVRFDQSVPLEDQGECRSAGEGLDSDTIVSVHDELSRLPEKYRLPIVLCYLEGLTHEEAADQLGWPLGSVKGRLSRARDLLRNRLIRRGVGLSAATSLAALEGAAHAVVVPQLLSVQTIRAAVAISSTSLRIAATTSTISASASLLAQGVLRTMLHSQIRAITIPLIVGIGVISTSASVVAYQLGGIDKRTDQPAPGADVAAEPKEQQKPGGAQKTGVPGQTGTSKSTANTTKTTGPGGANQPFMGMSPKRTDGGPGGGMGAMGGFGGGGMAFVDPVDGPRRRIESLERQIVSTLSNAITKEDKNPKSATITKKLDEPISMSFSTETPLEDVLKYIKSATADSNYDGIPVYVDPIGLADVEKTTTSTIVINLDGVPLKTTLRLVLNQLGLAYCVHDGFMMISSPRGIREELEQVQAELGLAEAVPNSLEQELQQLRAYVREQASRQGAMMGGGMGGMGGGMGGGMR